MNNQTCKNKYFTIKKAAEILNISMDDLLQLGIEGEIIISAYFYGWPIFEYECTDDGTDDELGSTMSDAYYLDSIKDISIQNLIFIQQTGKTTITGFPTAEGFASISDPEDVTSYVRYLKKSINKPKYYLVAAPIKKIPEASEVIYGNESPIITIENLLITQEDLMKFRMNFSRSDIKERLLKCENIIQTLSVKQLKDRWNNHFSQNNIYEMANDGFFGLYFRINQKIKSYRDIRQGLENLGTTTNKEEATQSLNQLDDFIKNYRFLLEDKIGYERLATKFETEIEPYCKSGSIELIFSTQEVTPSDCNNSFGFVLSKDGRVIWRSYYRNNDYPFATEKDDNCFVFLDQIERFESQPEFTKTVNTTSSAVVELNGLKNQNCNNNHQALMPKIIPEATLEYKLKKNQTRGQKDKYSFIFEDEKGADKNIALAYIYFLIKNKDIGFTKKDLLEKVRGKSTPLPPEKTSLTKIKQKHDLYLKRKKKVLEFYNRIKTANSIDEGRRALEEFRVYLSTEYENEKKSKTHDTIDPNVPNESKALETFCKAHETRFDIILCPLKLEIEKLEADAKPLKNTNRSVKVSINRYLKDRLKEEYPKFYCHLDKHLKYDESEKKYKYNSSPSPVSWIIQ